MLIPKINKQKLKDSKLMKSYNKFINNNLFISIVIKTLLTTLLWIGALIPFWIYLLSRWLIEPAGFWQEIAIFIIFALVIGWLQVGLGFFAVIFTLLILGEDV